MKKFLIALLAIVYLGVSSGFAMTIHYCMGKVSSVDLLSHSDKCDKCGMKKGPGGCCKDELKVYKINDSHQLLGSDINIFAPVTIIDNAKSIFDSKLPSSQIITDFNNHSPPGFSGSFLCILHCVFRV